MNENDAKIIKQQIEDILQANRIHYEVGEAWRGRLKFITLNFSIKVDKE